jgi:hypothetical protein
MTEYNFEKHQGETPFSQLVRISVDKLNKLHNMDWLDVKEQFGFEQSAESLRKYASGWKLLQENKESEEMSNPDTLIKYKETTEILSDGSRKSDKLITMSTEQSKDVNYLLKAHGFDVDDWELISARNNIWNVNSTTQGVQTLYSSKISVKPKGNGFNMDKLLEKIKQEVKPIIVKQPTVADSNLLEIPLFDMHFGIANLEYYNYTYGKILNKIESRKWDTVLFIVGQDLLHNDGFTGKTTSGTMIEQVNTEQAWSDADAFYTGLIKSALVESQNVHVVFSNGNHDQGIGYGFVKMLEVKFPQATFDTRMKQRKGYTWNDLFLGFSHGDKGSNRLAKNFLSEFGKEIANAKVVEVHSGHIHHEVTKDDFGIVIRSLATGAKTDDWHDEHGFIGSMKRFQLFEYSQDALNAIHYV